MKRKPPYLLVILVVLLFAGLLAVSRFVNANRPVDEDEEREHNAPAAAAPQGR